MVCGESKHTGRCCKILKSGTVPECNKGPPQRQHRRCHVRDYDKRLDCFTKPWNLTSRTDSMVLNRRFVGHSACVCAALQPRGVCVACVVHEVWHAQQA